MSRAGTRCGCEGRVRRKMTSRNSRHGANESKVFFIVLIAIWTTVSLTISSSTIHRTKLPLLATWEPAVLTRASATLPKLPSPISFRTSNLSSRARGGGTREDDLAWNSCMTAILPTSYALTMTMNLSTLRSAFQKNRERPPMLLLLAMEEAGVAEISD